MPARRIDGHDAAGYREIEHLLGNNAIVMEFTSYFARQRIPDEILGLLNGFPLCPRNTPAGRNPGVPDTHVTLYQSMVMRHAPSVGQQTPPDAGQEGTLNFEQHLRPLTLADRDALFRPPAGYRQVQ